MELTEVQMAVKVVVLQQMESVRAVVQQKVVMVLLVAVVGKMV